MGGGRLEVMKFAIYLTVPVGLTILATQYPDHLDAAIKNVRIACFV